MAIGLIAIVGSLVYLLNSEEQKPTVAGVVPTAGLGSPPPSVAAPVPDVPVPSTPGGFDPEQIFLQAIQTNSNLKSADQTRVLEVGRSMCTALDAGRPAREVIFGGSRDFTITDSGFIFGAAVVALCPRHEGKLSQLGVS
ncbi:DUF732 domain-containing protein [Sinosporangium siamense]|uniref:DUF732 domain-containing protein n=1 Tax=Sinosporangium siamense TaxID=1367973 RepID=UPI0035ED5300